TGVVAVLAIARSSSPHSPAMSGFGYSALGIAFGCIVLYAHWFSGTNHLVARFFRLRLLASFGKYSYAMYMFHTLVGGYVRVYIEGLGPLEVVVRILAKIGRNIRNRADFVVLLRKPLSQVAERIFLPDDGELTIGIDLKIDCDCDCPGGRRLLL